MPTFGLAIWWLDVVSFGGRNAVGLLFGYFIFCISIGLRFRTDVFQIPPHRQSVNINGNPMTTQYYKRHFDENRTEQSELWGTCDYYFETNLDGEILRQIEVYENGKRLKYSEQSIKDEFGFLGDQPIDLLEFKKFAITEIDFELQWQM